MGIPVSYTDSKGEGKSIKVYYMEEVLKLPLEGRSPEWVASEITESRGFFRPSSGSDT